MGQGFIIDYNITRNKLPNYVAALSISLIYIFWGVIFSIWFNTVFVVSAVIGRVLWSFIVNKFFYELNWPVIGLSSTIFIVSILTWLAFLSSNVPS
ncbi:MAG: hypothetical protein CUN55_17745 [Phototrophicales bacterium]|nr:MAG: hypothetical protein CUN55_17745 [Phototrophicales bacterium]